MKNVYLAITVAIIHVWLLIKYFFIVFRHNFISSKMQTLILRDNMFNFCFSDVLYIIKYVSLVYLLTKYARK